MGWPEEFGTRLREAMAKRRVGNAAIALKLGVHVTTVSKWRSGVHPIEHHRIPSLAKALDVSEVWLRDGDGDMQRTDEVVLSNSDLTATDLPRSLPQELRVAAKRFELEAMELGADDTAIAFIHHSLTSPEAVTMYHGGYKEPVSLDAMRKRQEAVMLGLRTWLEEYLKQQREAQRR
jgi:transcriptional regulator with XRE-family HTH domain